MGRAKSASSALLAKPINPVRDKAMGFAKRLNPSYDFQSLTPDAIDASRPSRQTRPTEEAHDENIRRCAFEFAAGRDRAHAGFCRRHDTRARAQRHQGAAKLAPAP